jgi:hypothetical protein
VILHSSCVDPPLILRYSVDVSTDKVFGSNGREWTNTFDYLDFATSAPTADCFTPAGFARKGCGFAGGSREGHPHRSAAREA